MADTFGFAGKSGAVLTLKKGSQTGTDYTITSGTFANIDSPNLDSTVTIPIGWKLYIRVTCNAYDTAGGSGVHLAIVDGATVIANTVCGAAATNYGLVSWDALIAGDGASHPIHIQFHSSSGGATSHIMNSSETVDGGSAGTIHVLYHLLPSA